MAKKNTLYFDFLWALLVDSSGDTILISDLADLAIKSDVDLTAYTEKVDTIKKLEYNSKVWNNRKLKTQGLRMCENCGNTLPYDSSFCNKCGYKLQPVSEELVII